MPEPAPAWPADRITRRKIADLIPDAKNARTHSDAQVEKIAASIERWGWTQPVILRRGSGKIVAGHGRVLAAQLLGYEEAPVIEGDWTEDEARAYALADNRLAELAGWDEDILRSELSALDADGFDLSALGFEDFDLSGDGGPGAGDGLPGGGGSDPSGPKRKLSERFGLAPFSVLSARDGWWQDRKRAWLSLGIESELGRGAAPGGSDMPAASQEKGKKTARGDGRGRRKPNAIPGGAAMPLDRKGTK